MHKKITTLAALLMTVTMNLSALPSSFVLTDKQDVPEDHFPDEDEISCAGVGRFELSITATVAETGMTDIKILVS